MRTIAAILILTLGAFALALTVTKPTSAQSVATPQQVGNLAAPTLSADVDERGVVLTWTLNAQVPNGWYLDEFAFLRKVGSDRSTVLSTSASSTDRTHIDELDSDTKTKWFSGTGISYKIRAVYKRSSDDQLRIGRESSFASVQGAKTTSQVRQGYSPQNVSSLAHADGVNLTWTFNEATMTPSGWKLTGFKVVRWLPGDVTGLVWVQSGDTWDGPDQRSFKDPLDHVPEAQRLPGFQWKYGVIAYYDLLASGSYSPRTQGKAAILTFTAPELPGPRNVQVTGSSDSDGYEHRAQLKWDDPHLTWDASRGFNQTPWYDIYRYDATFFYTSGWGNSYNFTSYTACWYGWWVRARIGMFYSDTVRAENNRTGTCSG